MIGKVGIAVIVHDRLESLQACVASIRANMDIGTYDLLVCCDCSNILLTNWLQSSDIHYIRADVRQGPPHTRNMALRFWEAQEWDRWQTVICMDDDCRAVSWEFASVWAAAAQQWGLVEYDFERSDTSRRDVRIGGACGACVAISRPCLEQAGYEHPAFYSKTPAQGYGYEDAEFGERCARFGDGNRRALAFGVEHLGGQGWYVEGNGLERHRVKYEGLLRDMGDKPTRVAYHSNEVERHMMDRAVRAAVKRLPEERLAAPFVAPPILPGDWDNPLVRPAPSAPNTERWEGAMRPSGITVTLAHWNMPECLPPIIELYRLQQDANGRALCPHIVIVDTGSTYENMQLLEGLRAPDVEIHYVRSHSYPHSSGPVAVACDLAVALCQTRWLFMTHCDAFPVRRDLLADLRARCEEGDYIVAGYRMSDRSFVHDGPDTEGVPGHMCTLWDVHAIWDYGISFSISRCYRDMGIDTDMHSRIDTETLPGRLLNRYGLTHRFLQLGIETNNERQVTDYIDHRRSLVGMKIYAFERYAACLQSLADAIGTAWDRVWRWKSAKAGVTEADK